VLVFSARRELAEYCLRLVFLILCSNYMSYYDLRKNFWAIMSYYDLRKNPHVILRSNYIICHTPPQGIIHLPYRNSRTDIWAMQGMINSRFRTLLPQGRLAWDLQVMRATNTWLEWWVRIPSEFWMPIETIAIAWVPLACASIFSKDKCKRTQAHVFHDLGHPP